MMMMARRRVGDVQQSHPQPHPKKKRGRPKGKSAPMEPLSLRVPSDVLDEYARRALAQRTSVKQIVRAILIAASRAVTN